jgi:hypothetical protein
MTVRPVERIARTFLHLVVQLLIVFPVASRLLACHALADILRFITNLNALPTHGNLAPFSSRSPVAHSSIHSQNARNSLDLNPTPRQTRHLLPQDLQSPLDRHQRTRLSLLHRRLHRFRCRSRFRVPVLFCVRVECACSSTDRMRGWFCVL